jgi:hypothetical protein
MVMAVPDPAIQSNNRSVAFALDGRLKGGHDAVKDGVAADRHGG